jgi:hypothetical protein
VITRPFLIKTLTSALPVRFADFAVRIIIKSWGCARELGGYARKLKAAPHLRDGAALARDRRS